jgi:outer membrane protein OmpA-like peptidoglycan-associated protein
MKKLFLMLAVATFAANVSAQNTVITSNKAGDNWYLGINAGVATPISKYNNANGDKIGFMKGFAPKLGVRLGKNLTTVFGLALDADVYFEASEKSAMKQYTFIDAINVDILGTFNLSNAFAGYQGEPRAFEVIGLVGGGYSHTYGCVMSGLNAKAGLDFAFNLGANKAWQLYIEPAIVFGQPFPDWSNPFHKIEIGGEKKYNAIGQVSVGLNYKFGNSNGSHNFAKAQLRDQSEIDQMQAKINELRAESNAKDGKIAADGRTIADLQAQLVACQNKPAPTAKVVVKQNSQLQPIVIFGAGKTSIDAAQYASIEMVAKYMRNHKDAKILVKGYASPEGDEVKNKALADGRAESVKNALIKRYKIAADRITAEGMGATSDLSEENDFNRVAMFFDTTVK